LPLGLQITKVFDDPSGSPFGVHILGILIIYHSPRGLPHTAIDILDDLPLQGTGGNSSTLEVAPPTWEIRRMPSTLRQLLSRWSVSIYAGKENYVTELSVSFIYINL
jgi:hypothetical protein